MASTGVAYAQATTAIVEPDMNTLVFPLPYYGIKSVRNSTGTSTVNYTCYEKYTSTAASGVVTFTTSSGTFSSFAGVGISGGHIGSRPRTLDYGKCRPHGGISRARRVHPFGACALPAR